MKVNAATRLLADARQNFDFKLHEASDLYTRLGRIFRRQLTLNKVDASIGVKEVGVPAVLRALQKLGYTLNARSPDESHHFLSLNGTTVLEVHAPRDGWDPVIRFV